MKGLNVIFQKQGGARHPGVAIGQAGSKLLIAYTIADGERTRWIPANRIFEVDGDREVLPRYVKRTCPGTKFDKPQDWYNYPDCPRCHGPHPRITERCEGGVGQRVVATKDKANAMVPADTPKPEPKREPVLKKPAKKKAAPKGKAKHKTRESWLQAAAKELRPLFKRAGNGAYPKILQVSCSWPGGGSARTRIGECWSETMSEGGATEIFISPNVADPVAVLDILTHELVHAIVGTEAGHGPIFRKLAVAVGLEGKMTATVAGPALESELKQVAKNLGRYPHAKLNLSGRKKQTTRMLKCECADCGYVCRTTSKWLEKLGAPICPGCEEQMEVPLP